MLTGSRPSPVSRVLFYCQSSLGIGHMVRSLRIAGGLGRHFQVHFLNGGERLAELAVPDGIELIQLPAITTDAEFTRLESMTPGLGLEESFDRRRAMLLEACERLAPDILLVELYPFGRGQFSTELKPLLKLARRQGTKVACSLRDILVARRDPEAYERKVVDRMNQFFDLLLVHSDPAFQRLDATFSRLGEIRAPVRYTGYVVPEVSSRPERREPHIIASIGGGRFGHELAEAVVRAAPLLAGRIPHRISLYTGPFCPDNVAAHLGELAAGQDNIEVQRFTPDLHAKLQTAALSISMGGYNTTMNILATGVRALMMGCTNNGGMDQVERIQKLERLGVVSAIHPADLEPAAFADRVIQCLASEPAATTLNINGVENTAMELQTLLEHEHTDQHGSTRQCLA